MAGASSDWRHSCRYMGPAHSTKGLAGPVDSRARASRVPPQSVSHGDLPRRQLERRVREAARSSHPLGAGSWISQPVAAAGEGCSRANGTLRRLEDWLVHACYQ